MNTPNNMPAPLGRIDKEVIRQQGRSAMQSVRAQYQNELPRISQDPQAETAVRTAAMKLVHAQHDGLSRFEKDLVVQYVMHGLNEPERSDAWLNGLEPLRLDSVPRPRTSVMMRCLLFLAPVLQLIAPLLPPGGKAERNLLWMRENRQRLRLLMAGWFLTIAGALGVLEALACHQPHPNWGPPTGLLAFGLFFLFIARR